MDYTSRIIYLYQNEVCFSLFLADLLYKLQYFLIKKGLTNFVFLSSKENKNRKELINLISEKADYLICRSARLGLTLRKFKCEIILDCEVAKLPKLRQGEMYALMWTLVFCSYVTEKTKYSSKGFIPENFPVKKSIFIPYHDRLDLLCDYIFQTAKVLSSKGYLVHLIPLTYPISIFKKLTGKKIKSNLDFLNKNKIIVNFPPSVFPESLHRYGSIMKINKKTSHLYSIFLTKVIKPDLIWCFDPQDYKLIEATKKLTKSIYDCVDYFSTLDQSFDREIKKNEKKLISAVDYFFVNSKTLFQLKKKIRTPDAVVVQGFDQEQFTSQDPLTSVEQKELSYLTKKFKMIPHPRVGFIGNITFRIDFELFLPVVRNMKEVSFVFTDTPLSMPADDKFANIEVDINELKKAKNVYFLPRTESRKVIREFLKNIDIGMIPYNIEYDLNRFCYPMKLFEYFYAEKPVVSTSIDELRIFPNFVKIGRTDMEWGRIIVDFMSKPWPQKYKEEQRDLALKNSWENKIGSILNLIV